MVLISDTWLSEDENNNKTSTKGNTVSPESQQVVIKIL